MLKERYLLVDAYNVIHAVPGLRKHLADGLDAARDVLAELLDWAAACERRLLQEAARRRKENEIIWRNGVDL